MTDITLCSRPPPVGFSPVFDLFQLDATPYGVKGLINYMKDNGNTTIIRVCWGEDIAADYPDVIPQMVIDHLAGLHAVQRIRVMFMGTKTSGGDYVPGTTLGKLSVCYGISGDYPFWDIWDNSYAMTMSAPTPSSNIVLMRKDEIVNFERSPESPTGWRWWSQS